MGNYIKVNRKILNWEWWKDKNTFRLFMYMLLSARWKPDVYKGVEIERGSFTSSITKLSQETSLTINEVRTALKHLKSTGEITSKTYPKFTVFTVNNYNLYQDDNKVNNNEITGKITSNFTDKSHEESLQNNTQDNAEITGSNIHSIYNIHTEQKNVKNVKNDKQEKEREESNNNIPPLIPPQGEEKQKRETYKQLYQRILLEFNISDYLLEAVDNWIEYKHEQRFTYKERGMRTLLRKISDGSREYGDQAMYDTISESIASGYDGIVWNKLNKFANKKPQNSFWEEWENA